MPGIRIALAGLVASLTAAAVAAAAPPPAEGPWILTCDMPSAASAASATRVFRIAPRVFQEWRPADKTFGNNLCASFPCAADRNRLQGTISSSSVVFTVQVDRQKGSATWRTQGASNLAKSTGACSIHPESSAPPR